jgi:hypothetical protein
VARGELARLTREVEIVGAVPVFAIEGVTVGRSTTLKRTTVIPPRAARPAASLTRRMTLKRRRAMLSL